MFRVRSPQQLQLSWDEKMKIKPLYFFQGTTRETTGRSIHPSPLAPAPPPLPTPAHTTRDPLADGTLSREAVRGGGGFSKPPRTATTKRAKSKPHLLLEGTPCPRRDVEGTTSPEGLGTNAATSRGRSSASTIRDASGGVCSRAIALLWTMPP